MTPFKAIIVPLTILSLYAQAKQDLEDTAQLAADTSFLEKAAPTSS